MIFLNACRGVSRPLFVFKAAGSALNYKEKYLYGTDSFLSIFGLVCNNDTSTLILEGVG